MKKNILLITFLMSISHLLLAQPGNIKDDKVSGVETLYKSNKYPKLKLRFVVKSHQPDIGSPYTVYNIMVIR